MGYLQLRVVGVGSTDFLGIYLYAGFLFEACCSFSFGVGNQINIGWEIRGERRTVSRRARGDQLIPFGPVMLCVSFTFFPGRLARAGERFWEWVRGEAATVAFFI